MVIKIVSIYINKVLQLNCAHLVYRYKRDVDVSACRVGEGGGNRVCSYSTHPRTNLGWRLLWFKMSRDFGLVKPDLEIQYSSSVCVIV